LRICAAADIHYPRTHATRCAGLARAMCESGAEVLVLAGDISAGEEKHYRKLLRLFGDFEGPKLFVPGNHDLWSLSRHPNTPHRYHDTLRHIVERQGFRYLPGDPLAHGRVGFVGTVGWYDYAFRQPQPPQPGLRVTPLRAVRTRQGPEFVGDPARREVPWEELTPADYAGHALAWRAEDAIKRVVWNDGLHVRWGDTDAETVERLRDELAADIAAIEERVDYWVAVLHFLPFAKLLGEPAQDIEAAYVRAFLGAPAFGRLLAEHPKCRLVLCGHRHEAQVLSVGDMVLANCSVGDGKAGPLLLTVE